MDDGYFDERIAASYDDDARMFDPAVVDPAVALLAALAGAGRALEVPRLQWLPPGETVLAFRADPDHWGIDEYDVVTQGLVSHHLRGVDGQIERHSTPFRYVWPAELDLMAQLAGLDRAARWGGWQKQPFTRMSDSHVSVWRKPAAG